MKTSHEEVISPEDKKIIAFLREGYRNTDARAKFGCTWYRADKFRRKLKLGKPTKELEGVSDKAPAKGKPATPAKPVAKGKPVAKPAPAKPVAKGKPATPAKPVAKGKPAPAKPVAGKGTVDAAIL